MKKASYAVVLGCVLLVLTFSAATMTRSPLTYAASMDNNIILSAINNAVTTLQNVIVTAQNSILNAITNAQNNINAHTDSAVNGQGQNSMIINVTIDVTGSHAITTEVLPEVQGQTYSGHITLAVYGSSYITIEVRAYVGGAVSHIGKADTSTDLNVDFACERLEFSIENSQTIQEPAIIRAVIQYTNCTNVSFPTLGT